MFSDNALTYVYVNHSRGRRKFVQRFGDRVCVCCGWIVYCDVIFNSVKTDKSLSETNEIESTVSKRLEIAIALIEMQNYSSMPFFFSKLYLHSTNLLRIFRIE